MSQTQGEQGSFFDDEEKHARQVDGFKKRAEQMFGVPFSEIDLNELRQTNSEISDDERKLDREAKNEEAEAKRHKDAEETLRLIRETEKRLNSIDSDKKE